VVRDVYDDPAFLRQLADAVRSLRVGPSWELSTSVGPIIRGAEPALARALHHLDLARVGYSNPVNSTPRDCSGARA